MEKGFRFHFCMNSFFARDHVKLMNLILWILNNYYIYVFNFSASLEIKTWKCNHPFLSVQHLFPPCRSGGEALGFLLRQHESSEVFRVPRGDVAPSLLRGWFHRRSRRERRRRHAEKDPFCGGEVVWELWGGWWETEKKQEKEFEKSFLILSFWMGMGGLREFSIVSKPIQKSYLKIGVVNAHFFPKSCTVCTHKWCKFCIGRSR